MVGKGEGRLGLDIYSGPPKFLVMPCHQHCDKWIITVWMDGLLLARARFVYDYALYKFTFIIIITSLSH